MNLDFFWGNKENKYFINSDPMLLVAFANGDLDSGCLFLLAAFQNLILK